MKPAVVTLGAVRLSTFAAGKRKPAIPPAAPFATERDRENVAVIEAIPGWVVDKRPKPSMPKPLGNDPLGD